jgi:hypothetical protein
MIETNCEKCGAKEFMPHKIKCPLVPILGDLRETEAGDLVAWTGEFFVYASGERYMQ